MCRREVTLDDDTAALIARLCARAGMIMEDASMPAITMPRQWSRDAEVALNRLAQEISAASKLIDAAEALAAVSETKPIG